MVGLVDHEQAERIAQAMHLAPGALEGGHRDAVDPMFAVAEAAGHHPEQFLDGARPLIEEHARGHQTERGDIRPRHRGDGQAGLARAGRHDRDAPPPGELPGGQGRLLIGPQRYR